MTKNILIFSMSPPWYWMEKSSVGNRCISKENKNYKKLSEQEYLGRGRRNISTQQSLSRDVPLQLRLPEGQFPSAAQFPGDRIPVTPCIPQAPRGHCREQHRPCCCQEVKPCLCLLVKCQQNSAGHCPLSPGAGQSQGWAVCAALSHPLALRAPHRAEKAFRAEQNAAGTGISLKTGNAWQALSCFHLQRGWRDGGAAWAVLKS